MQSSSAPEKKTFRPGDTAPVAGIYDVVHDAHRPPHTAILLKDETFPACRTCKDAVRFTLSRNAIHVSGDSDLKSPG
jgi:hypothetical protein